MQRAATRARIEHTRVFIIGTRHGCQEWSNYSGNSRSWEVVQHVRASRSNLEELTQTVGGDSAPVASLVKVELSCVRLVITAALIQIESTVSEAICHVLNGFPSRHLVLRLVYELKACLTSLTDYYFAPYIRVSL